MSLAVKADPTGSPPTLDGPPSFRKALIVGPLGPPETAATPTQLSVHDAERCSLNRLEGLWLYTARPLYLAGGPELGRFTLIATVEDLEPPSAERVLRKAVHLAERAATPIVLSIAPSLTAILRSEKLGPGLAALRDHPGARWIYLAPQATTSEGQRAPRVAPLVHCVERSLQRTRTPYHIVGLETGGEVHARFGLDDLPSTIEQWRLLADAGLASPLRAPDGRAYYPAVPSFARRRGGAEHGEPSDAYPQLSWTLFCADVARAAWSRLSFEERDSPTVASLTGAFSALTSSQAHELTEQEPGLPARRLAGVDATITPAHTEDRPELEVTLRMQLDGTAPEERTTTSARLYVDLLPKRREGWTRVFSAEYRRTRGALHLERADLSAANVTGQTAVGSSFRECAFDAALVTYSDFDKSSFTACAGRGASFRSSSVRAGRLSDCSFPESSFSRLKLLGAQVERCNFRRASFVEAILIRGSFVDTSFADADLWDAAIDDALFRGCDFSGAYPDPRTLSMTARFESCRFDQEVIPARMRVLIPGLAHHPRAPREPWELPLRILFVDDFVQGPDPRPVGDRLPEAIDKVHRKPNGLSKWTTLSSPLGQALERFVEALEPNNSIRIDVLNLSKEDLQSDEEDNPSPGSSGLDQILYSGEYGGAGGRPFGALVLGHTFEMGGAAPRLLCEVLQTCARAHMPLILPLALEPQAEAILAGLRHYVNQAYLGFADAANVGQVLVRTFLENGMADQLFANQKALSAADLDRYAAAVGLDVDKFKHDLASQEIKDEVGKDVEAARSAGVSGTPTIYVNGRPYVGERSVDGFRPVIEQELAAAEALLKGGTPLAKVYETRARANAAPASPTGPGPAPSARAIPMGTGRLPDVPRPAGGGDDFDGLLKESGASPAADADGDGIPDSKDQCPSVKETKNLVNDQDGCPD